MVKMTPTNNEKKSCKAVDFFEDAISVRQASSIRFKRKHVQTGSTSDASKYMDIANVADLSHLESSFGKNL